MRRFRAGEVQVLVATTVIEVGIDVPNATIMLIEHPERFGLAQLHQLRGRVGAAPEESYCILLAEARPPERLKAFAATQDGFKIAELDLAERGMGDLIGARQSGGFEVRHARLPGGRRSAGAGPRAGRSSSSTRDPALQRRGESAAPGAGGGAISAGGGAVSGGVRRLSAEADVLTRTAALRSDPGAPPAGRATARRRSRLRH